MMMASKDINKLEKNTATKVAPPLEKGTLVKVKEQSGTWRKVVVETEGWVSSEWVTK